MLDPDTANGNATDMTKTETVKEDINKNEKVVKNTKNANKKSANKMANNESNVKDVESYGNGKNETDKVVNVEQVKTQPAEEMAPPKPVPEDTSKIEQQTSPQIFVPKYKYSEGLASCNLIRLLIYIISFFLYYMYLYFQINGRHLILLAKSATILICSSK